MTKGFLDGFDEYRLEDYRAVTKPKTEVQKAQERHTCIECNGTGLYQGVRLHQDKQHCFACKGKGWFKTSYADRMKARQKARDRKQAAHEAKQAAFDEANEGLIEQLRAIAGWHQFAASMLEAYDKWGKLTDKQTAAARAALAKVEAKRKEREAKKAAEAVTIDLSPIRDMFAKAIENGAKKPTYRAEGLVISKAPAHGKNAGALYIKSTSHVYGGKLTGTVFKPSYEGKEADFATYTYTAEETGERITVSRTAADALAVIAANPAEAAALHGKRSGICSCCGRELTDPESIAAGIGPICASKWF